jgi:hypothetical protein
MVSLVMGRIGLVDAAKPQEILRGELVGALEAPEDAGVEQALKQRVSFGVVQLARFVA